MKRHTEGKNTKQEEGGKKKIQNCSNIYRKTEGGEEGKGERREDKNK